MQAINRLPKQIHAPADGLTREQRAAINFMGALHAAGLDGSSKAGVDQRMLVPPIVTAGLIGLRVQTLAVMRMERHADLPHVQIGRRVFYKLGDVLSFIERRTQQPRQAA